MTDDGTTNGSPRVRILQSTWTRLWAYIHACQVEVGGLGTVESRGGSIVITDVFLLKQRAGVAHTTLDTAAVRDFQIDWVKQGKDPELLKFWWHSHAKFPVSWSSTDERTIRALTERHAFVTCVGNHRGEMRTRITTSAPARRVFDYLPLDVMPEVGAEAQAAADAEVAEKVTIDTPGGVERLCNMLGLTDDVPLPYRGPEEGGAR